MEWPEDPNECIEGIEVKFVCKTVPVLSLDKLSVFHDNVSWMLQTALGSTTKADLLYEYCDDAVVYAECRKLGIHDEEVLLAGLPQEGLRHLRAVGISGKRSVMMAVLFALLLDQGDRLEDFWSEMQGFRLEGPLRQVLRHYQPYTPLVATAMMPPDDKVLSADAVNIEGAELQIICGCVPVVNLDKGSIFSESASWLLQLTSGAYLKADSLYEFFNDETLFTACRRLGLSKQDVGVVRLTRPDLRGVRAVGTCGKRSIMLALVVAMVLCEEVDPEHILREAATYDEKLERPLHHLFKAALAALKGARRQINGLNGGAASPVAKRPKLAAPMCLTTTPEEMKARSERAQRFEAASKAPSRSPEGIRFGDQVEKAASTDEKPLEGVCTTVEKPYLRLTTLPQASDIRPLPVLKQAFQLVCEKWSQERDWVYTGEQLRSIRQDITVQMVRNEFAVEVYEFCARAALEVGDFRQFDQCSTQLEDLYSATGAAAHANEFMAYRLLYLAVQNDDLALSAFLRERRRQLSTARGSGDLFLTHSWGLRGDLVGGSLRKLAGRARLVVEVATNSCEQASSGSNAPSGGGSSTGASSLPVEGFASCAARRLTGMLVEGERLKLLASLCRALRPGPSRRLLLRLLPRAGELHREDPLGDLPVVWRPDAPDQVDAAATLKEAEKLLARSNGGARLRLGAQSSEHVKGFMRMPSSSSFNNG